MSYRDRLQKVIPGGAHTYSRGADQHPANAPQILARGKGAYVYDDKGARFLDYGMALRAVNIGYAEDEIDEAAIREIRNGDNLTLPTLIELEAAERFCELIDSVDMVKFTKNGSTSVSAAVKLARAFTRRELVARCAEHPFFSYDDWFIGSTPVTRGVPTAAIEQTKLFRYNDAASVRALFDQHPGEIACVVMEAAATAHPEKGFLEEVQRLCRKHGAVLIFDEMITGFRWHLKGAQHYYGVRPDLCTFGKAMANGFSVSCIAGRREIMELGSIETPGRERVFLLSTTHGAEMAGMGAFVATLRYLGREPVIDHLWRYGQQLVELINRVSREFGTQASLSAGGVPCSPYYSTLDRDGKPSLELRTLFAQEMVRNGVLMPWIALSYRHREAELALTEEALRAALPVYRRGLDEGCKGLLLGEPIKPVFRKYN
jgi:glutamate-1-semialdehyde 2,1-aminomutase